MSSRTLFRLNVGCAITHALLTMFTLSQNLSLQVVVFSSDVTVHPDILAWFQAGATAPLDVESFLIPAPSPLDRTVPLTLLSALFPALSCMFHIGNAVVWRAAYDEWVLRAASNPMRWVEYTLSAPLMVFCLLPLAGQIVLTPMLLVTALVGVTQFFGWTTEVIARPSCLDIAVAEWSRPRTLILTTHFLGWVPMLIAWAALVTPLLGATSEAAAPSWIVGLVAVEFVLFSCFGLVQIVLYGCGHPRHYATGEMVYQILSLTAKALLTGVLYAQLLGFERLECILEQVQSAAGANC